MADLASFKSRERQKFIILFTQGWLGHVSASLLSNSLYSGIWILMRRVYTLCLSCKKDVQERWIFKKQMWYVWSLFNVNQSPFYYRVIDYGRRGTQCWERGRKASSSFKLYSQSSDKKNIKLSEGLLCFIDSAIFDPLERNWCFPKKRNGIK